MLHQCDTLCIVVAGDELVDGIDKLLLERHQIDLSTLRRAVVPAGARTRCAKLRRVLHDGRVFRSISVNHPVEAAGIVGRIALFAVEGIQHDPKTELLHLPDDAFGEVAVGRIAVVDKKHDLDVLPTGLVGREVDEAVAVGVFQASFFEQSLRAIEVKGIIDGRLPVIEAGAGGKSARIDRRERTLHQRLAELLAIHRHGHRLAEILVAVELAHGLGPFVRLAPAIGREVHVQIVADEARAEGKPRGCRILGSALQRFDEVFRLLEVGEIGGTGNRLHVAVGPGRELVVQLVDVRELVAGLVHLPVVGVAAQHDDIVSTVGDRHPGAHDGDVHVFRREGVLVLVVGRARIFRVFGFEDMRRAGAEGAIGHGIEVLAREGLLEGPFDRVLVDLLQRRSGAEGLRRCAVQRRYIRVEDIVVPVEHDVVGVEGVAVRPFRTLDEMHCQLVAVGRPVPAPGKVWQRLDVLRFHLEERCGAGQTFRHADIDAAPALALAGRVVPAFRPAADDVAQRIAIDADAIGHVAGLEDHRLLRQALGNRRQLAGLDVFFGDPGRLLVLRQRLELGNRVARHIGDLALGREWRLLGHD
ncbi:hypothetical protein D9M72_384660 [compost metagenome]